MKLDAPQNEIKFDEQIGTVARFAVLLEGEPTMYVTCDMADPERTIRIQRFKTSADVFATKGHFTTHTKLTEDVDGMPTGAENRVDRMSVYKYVIPRLHVLLGRLLRAA